MRMGFPYSAILASAPAPLSYLVASACQVSPFLLRPALLPEDSLPSFSVMPELLPFVCIAAGAIARANQLFSGDYVTRRYLGLPGLAWCSSTRMMQEDKSLSARSDQASWRIHFSP